MPGGRTLCYMTIPVSSSHSNPYPFARWYICVLFKGVLISGILRWPLNSPFTCQLCILFRVTPIATDLFTIHHKTLHLLQAQWHPSLSHSLLLLTSDSTLRCFSMADPNYARYSIPLTPSAASQVRGLKMCPY